MKLGKIILGVAGVTVTPFVVALEQFNVATDRYKLACQRARLEKLNPQQDILYDELRQPVEPKLWEFVKYNYACIGKGFRAPKGMEDPSERNYEGDFGFPFSKMRR